jgi:hypothetical protein
VFEGAFFLCERKKDAYIEAMKKTLLRLVVVVMAVGSVRGGDHRMPQVAFAMPDRPRASVAFAMPGRPRTLLS